MKKKSKEESFLGKWDKVIKEDDQSGREKTKSVDTKKKEKRFWLSIVEYGVMNPTFQDFRVARIEVHDRESDSPYQIYEGHITLPVELMDKFREIFDFLETDLPIRIDFNMFDERCFPDIHEKYYGKKKGE